MACLISTRRLKLFPFGPEHIHESYIGWLNDPKLMQFSQNQGRKHDAESCRLYARDFDHETKWLWAIQTLNGDHIGNINAYLSPAHSVADIGLLVGKGQGQGFGSEAWQGVMDALFRFYGVRKVTGGCVREHANMTKIMKNSGMKPDGSRAEHLLLGGKPRDIVFFAQFCSIYEPQVNVEHREYPSPDWRN